MGYGRGTKGCSVAIVIPAALPRAATGEESLSASGEGATAATGEGAMVAMELLRESVLGARQGSPRHGKRCVRFDLEGARLLHQKLQEESQKRDQGGVLPIEVKRIEVQGSRHGTPPRTWGFPGVPDKECTSQQVQQERETRKASSEKLPQSSSVQVQRLVTALQLAPRRSQSCAASSEGLPVKASHSPVCFQSSPSPYEDATMAIDHLPVLSLLPSPPFRATSQPVASAASSPLAPSPSSCLPPLSSPPTIPQSLRKPSLRASRPGSWTVPTHLLQQEERRDMNDRRANMSGTHKAELMSESRDCPSQGDVWPRSCGAGQPELHQRARRVARKAVSERLPQGPLHLKEGPEVQGSSEALGLSEIEQSEFREWRPRAMKSTQSFHSSPVHRSPRRGVGGSREAGNSDNASPMQLQAPTRTSSLGTPSQSRPMRLLDRKRILGARMTLDEQTLRYYAGNH